MFIKYTILSFSSDNSSLREFKFLKKLSNNEIQVIDATNHLNLAKDIRVYKVKDFDNDFLLHKESHLKIADIISQISQKTAKFYIEGLNLFWQTNLSEKADYYSTCSKMIFFEMVLNRSKELQTVLKTIDRIHVIYPPCTSNYLHIFIKKIIYEIDKSFSVSSNISELRNLKIKYSKRYYFLKLFKTWFFILKNKTKNTKEIFRFKSIVFLSPTKSKNITKPENKIWKCLENDGEYLNLRQIVYEKKFDIKRYCTSEDLKKFVMKNMPLKKDLLSIFFRVLIIEWQYLFYKLGFSNKKDSLLLKTALFEISHALYELDNLVLYVWYRNLFKSIPKKSVFLITDEFYKSGRLICAAKKASGNKKVRIVGMQHGMFGESHALYKITTSMCSGKNALPIPDNFIVWGRFFKNFFHQFNDLQKSYTHIASFLKPSVVNGKNNNPKKKILWCTTLPELSLFDLDLLSTIEDAGNYEIILREHPNFEIMSLVKDNINQNHQILKNIIRDNSEPINKVLTSVDIVLAQNPSTVIIDSLLSQTPVLYSDSGVRVCDFQDNFKAGIYIIRNKKDFKQKFPLAINQKGTLDKGAMSEFINNQFSIVEVLNTILKKKVSK